MRRSVGQHGERDLKKAGGNGMSSKKKPLVVVTRRLPDIIETRMRELFNARLNLVDEKMSHDALVNVVRKARRTRRCLSRVASRLHSRKRNLPGTCRKPSPRALTP